MDINISNEQLEEARVIAWQASKCHKFYGKFLPCFLGKEEGANKTNGCLSCRVREFRKTLEYESPALYGKILELSRYNAIIHDFRVLAVEGSPLQQEEIKSEFMDLLFFCHAVIFVLHPLFLANNKTVPPFKSEEIRREIEAIESDKEKMTRIFERIRQINPNWHQWINNYYIYIGNQYIKTIAAIASLFLNKIAEEKEKFFSDIEGFLKELKK